MSGYVIHEENYKGFTIKIVPDDRGSVDSPREFDGNFGTMVCWHRRYNLGDEQRRNDPDDFFRELASRCRTPIDCDQASMGTIRKIVARHYLILPLFLYDHSGLRIKIGSFHGLLPQGHAEFDSGQVGWIYVSHKDIRDNWSVKSVRHKVTDHDGKRIKAIDYARRLLESEVMTYDDYLSGNIAGYIVEHDGDQIDSCWSFYPDHNSKSEWGHCIDQARAAVDSQIRVAINAHVAQLKAWIKHNVPLDKRHALQVA